MAGDSQRERFEQGRVASHPKHTFRPLRVAPATGSELNTLSLPLPAVACMQMADVLFEFDSSFVLPEAAAILKDLPALRDSHTNKAGLKPPLAIFGHTDPVGKDDYNKRLSGRRAKAIYGLLLNDAGIWKALLKSPMGGDDWKKKGAIATMKNFLGASAPKQEGAIVEAYQKALFPTPVTKTDFIAQGAHAKGRADLQGCSEFNLLVSLSEGEIASLSEAARNHENRPNRRVVIYLFRAGSKVNPNLWPCPTADDASTALCKKQFFVTPPPGDQRRRHTAERREHAKLADTTEDTFACSFYDEISHLSPCEEPVRPKQCCRLRATVEDNLDPVASGRLRVRIPELGDQPVWAMPAVPFAGPKEGLWTMPPIGANVWVEFEGGDTNRPIWSGCFWSPGEAPPEAAATDSLLVKTDGNVFVMSAQNGFRVEVTGKARIELRDGAVLDSGAGSKIELAGAQVRFNGEAIEVT